MSTDLIKAGHMGMLFLSELYCIVVELQMEGTVLVKPRANVAINCTLASSPTVQWYKNGKHITDGSEYHLNEQNGTLTIYRAGIYYFSVY